MWKSLVHLICLPPLVSCSIASSSLFSYALVLTKGHKTEQSVCVVYTSCIQSAGSCCFLLNSSPHSDIVGDLLDLPRTRVKSFISFCFAPSVFCREQKHITKIWCNWWNFSSLCLESFSEVQFSCSEDATAFDVSYSHHSFSGV